jgi:hypothetical protein
MFETICCPEGAKLEGDWGCFIAPKQGEEFSQGLTSPIVLVLVVVLVLDFDRH